MPIHDLGYRAWRGSKSGIWSRWMVIAMTGIRIAARSQWIRRTLLFSWLPALSLGVFFFTFERAVDEHELYSNESPNRQFYTRVLDRSPLKRDADLATLIDGLTAKDASVGRRMVWSWMFTSFFKYSQGVMMLLLVGLIAPPLISKDVRTRAFLLYFAKPIGRVDYILGKLCVPAAFVAFITLVPGLLLYVFAVLLAPDFSVVLDTWDIPLRVVAASLVSIIPASCLALMFSSLTSESRFAGFAWFALWTLGGMAWLIIYGSLVAQHQHELGFTDVTIDSNFSLLSIYHTIGKVQRWIFGLEPDLSEVLPSIVLLSGLTVFSLVVLWRRVSVPIRV